MDEENATAKHEVNFIWNQVAVRNQNGNLTLHPQDTSCEISSCVTEKFFQFFLSSLEDKVLRIRDTYSIPFVDVLSDGSEYVRILIGSFMTRSSMKRNYYWNWILIRCTDYSLQHYSLYYTTIHSIDSSVDLFKLSTRIVQVLANFRYYSSDSLSGI